MSKVKVLSVSQSVSQSVTRSPIELFWTAKNNEEESFLSYQLNAEFAQCLLWSIIFFEFAIKNVTICSALLITNCQWVKSGSSLWCRSTNRKPKKLSALSFSSQAFLSPCKGETTLKICFIYYNITVTQTGQVFGIRSDRLVKCPVLVKCLSQECFFFALLTRPIITLLLQSRKFLPQQSSDTIWRLLRKKLSRLTTDAETRGNDIICSLNNFK